VTYRFGPFRLDLATRELRDATAPIALSPKALRLLEILVAASPAVIDKETLIERVWEGAFVSDGGLPVLVSMLREALGDDPKAPRYIRTAHRMGYSFLGPVEAAESAGETTPHLLYFGEGKMVRLRAGELVVGRGAEADVRIDDPSVSREHARLYVTAEGAELEDRGSKNGVWVDGSRLAGRVRLREGQRLRFGNVRATLAVPSDEAPTQTAEARGTRSSVALPRPAAAAASATPARAPGSRRPKTS
jgi:DNA-binding winged helix-turn-helix (wHTH) protein